VKLLAQGRSNKEVASDLDISVKTVDAHRTNIMRKLNLRSYSELIHFAIRHKIIEI
jgi:DNA-binding NarL/FixJ family response regulator